MKEKAQDIIAQSDLTQEDKQMWFVYFDSAPESLLRMFAELFESNASELPFATQSLKTKVAAQGDIEKIKAIVRSDEQAVLNAA